MLTSSLIFGHTTTFATSCVKKQTPSSLIMLISSLICGHTTTFATSCVVCKETNPFIPNYAHFLPDVWSYRTISATSGELNRRCGVVCCHDASFVCVCFFFAFGQVTGPRTRAGAARSAAPSERGWAIKRGTRDSGGALRALSGRRTFGTCGVLSVRLDAARVSRVCCRARSSIFQSHTPPVHQPRTKKKVDPFG